MLQPEDEDKGRPRELLLGNVHTSSTLCPLSNCDWVAQVTERKPMHTYPLCSEGNSTHRSEPGLLKYDLHQAHWEGQQSTTGCGWGSLPMPATAKKMKNRVASRCKTMPLEAQLYHHHSHPPPVPAPLPSSPSLLQG